MKKTLLKMVWYSGVDSELVYNLVQKNVLSDAFVNSSIQQVNIYKLYARGVQVKIAGLYFRECMTRGFTCIKPWSIKVAKSGGNVFPPEQGVHEKTATYDFSKLYPSIIMAGGLSPDAWILSMLPEAMRIMNDSLKSIKVTIETGGEDIEDEAEGTILSMEEEAITDEKDLIEMDLVYEANISNFMQVQTKQAEVQNIILKFDRTRESLLASIERKLTGSRNAYKKKMKTSKGLRDYNTHAIGLYKLAKVQMKPFSWKDYKPWLLEQALISKSLITKFPKGHAEWVKHYMIQQYTKDFVVEMDAKLDSRTLDMKMLIEKYITLVSKNEILTKYYDSAQKAVKVLMNSIYGALGTEHSIISCLPIATAIPTYGRRLIVMVAIAMMAIGCKLIYGDTDSVMIQFGKDTFKNLRIYLKYAGKVYWETPDRDMISEFITDLFPEGIDIEFEKFGTIIIFAKKRYTIYQDDGIVNHKGTSIVRRDKNLFNKETTRTVIEMIRFPTRNIYKVAKYIIKRVLMLLDEVVDPILLSSTRRIGQHYKDPRGFIPSFIKNCSPYIKLKSGVRYTLIVTKGDPNSNLGSRCLTVDVALRHKFPIDYVYYAWNDLRKGIEDIWLTGFMKELIFIERYRYLKRCLRYISEYTKKVNDVQSLGMLSSDLNMNGTARNESIPLYTILNYNELDIQTATMTTKVNGIPISAYMLIYCSLPKIIAHLIVIYPATHKAVIKELKKILNFLKPRPNLQVNIIKAIVRQFELSRKLPEKYKFGPFREKIESIQFDNSWERYFDLFALGKSTKQVDKELFIMFTILGINERVFMKLLNHIPVQYNISKASIPKLDNLPEVLSPFGKKAWRDLKMRAIWDSL